MYITMISQSLKIDELKKIFVEYTKTLNEREYAEKCLSQLEEYDSVFKNIEYSEKAEAEGNELFQRKDLDFFQLYKILVRYNESIALAPKNSENLASGYASKSAVLLRMRKYKECIAEIEKSLRTTELMSLKVKLLCRKAECLTALGSADNRRCLEKAKFIMTKFDGSEQEKSTLEKLIKKSQSMVDEGKLDIPKKDKRKMQTLKLIEEAERRDLSKSIKVEYSERYGRHLVAARDFKPGEIILAEKPYFNSLDDSRALQYCDHCFDHLWTAVPCDHCARRLYCSEKCKIEARNEHHEMECFAFVSMRLALNFEWTSNIVFLVSVFFKALKEAGSIEQLVADSEVPYANEDPTGESILTSADFTSYRSIFTLPVPKPDEDDWKISKDNSVAVLVGLAKYTEILGKTYDFKEMKKLMEDDTAILVGALLMKFDLLINGVHLSVNLTDPNYRDDDDEEPDVPYNKVLPFITMHTLSGCIPNVESFATHGNRFLMCAIRPVKAGSKLIANFKSESIWKGATKFERQLRHSNLYNCPCECEACTEDWSYILDDATKLNGTIIIELKYYPGTMELWEERNSILLEWETNCHKPSFPDIKFVSRAASLVAVSWKQLSLPSPIMIRSVFMLLRILEAFHNPSKIDAKGTNLHRQKLGNFLDIPELLRNIRFKNSITKCIA